MRRKLAVELATILIISLCGSVPTIRAQEQPTDKTKTEAATRSVEAYRVDFVINELEDGKKINTRQYSVNVAGSEPNSLKIGTRVPVEEKQGEFHYVDVGTNVWAQLIQHSTGSWLEVRAELSNFAVPEQANRADNSMPLLRQVQISAGAIPLLGQPMIVGRVDDPNSRRQYELEVTVSRLK
jgi:hypothetical protein